VLPTVQGGIGSLHVLLSFVRAKGVGGQAEEGETRDAAGLGRSQSCRAGEYIG
jgi:hypothetical protein